MAVTRVAERWEGRGTTADEKGVYTLPRQWTVETDSNTTGGPAVIAAVVAFDASAARYQPHPDWPWAVCRKLVAKPNGGPRVWLVDADYSSAPMEDPEQSHELAADKRPPKVSISRKEVTEPLEKDAVTGERVANTVGDRFDPTPEVFRSRHIVTWKFFRREEDLDWDNRSTWMDTINKDTVEIKGSQYDPHSLRVIDYALEEVMETGEVRQEKFMALTVQAEYKPDLWDVSILNTGRRQNVIGPLLTVIDVAEIVDRNGERVADPIPLAEDGTPVPAGDPYHYVEAAGYLEYDWNGADDTLTGEGGLLA